MAVVVRLVKVLLVEEERERAEELAATVRSSK